MQIIKYIQLPFHFDIGRLQQEVEKLANNAWRLHYQTLHYEGDWSAIPLRSCTGEADDIFISPLKGADYRNTEFLNSCPYIQAVLSKFKCTPLAVRLLKLNAGAVIKEHIDGELCFEKGEVRFHIPVITNDAVDFYLDKERLSLKEGECWYMNFNLPHSIINNSNTDRIHLVIDAVVNDWITDVFSRDDLPVKKMKELYDNSAKLQMIANFRAMNTQITNTLADELEKEIAAAENS